MNLARYNKAIVALVMTVIYFANEHFGVSIPVSQEMVSGIVVALIPALVYQVANKG